MKEQFAGWGSCDHLAVCLSCRRQHVIAKHERVDMQPWLDWQVKHHGHPVRLVPWRLINRLGERLASLFNPWHGFAHNADVKIAYATDAAYTITLASLATSSTLIAGQESGSVTNTSNLYLDELVSGQVMVGTTPTASTQIEVHAVGAINDTPTWPDVFDGTDSAETISNLGIKAAICAAVAIMPVTATTSDLAYPFRPLGIRQLFGDAMPPLHVLFVTHNTAVNLNATGGNHFIYHTPVYATVV